MADVTKDHTHPVYKVADVTKDITHTRCSTNNRGVMLIIANMDVAEIREKVIAYLQFQYQNVYTIRNAAEDIVNEALTKALEKEYELNYPVIRTIADNLAKREYHQQKRSPVYFSELEEKNVPIELHYFTFETSETLSAQKELQEVLAHAMQRLDQDTRHALEMQMEEYSIGEISQALGAPEGTVKSWISRGKQKLRPIFEKVYGTKEIGIEELVFTDQPKPIRKPMSSRYWMA